MKGYTEYKVGKEPIFVKNLISDGIFSQEMFSRLLDRSWRKEKLVQLGFKQ